MSQTPEETAKTTEQLLEQFSICALAVADDLSKLAGNEIKYVEKNEHCIIAKMPEKAKKEYPFEYIGVVFINEFIRLLTEEKLSNLILLGLSENQLTSLPPEIGQLQNLIFFDLSNNQLKILSSEVMQLQNLTTLNLSGNQLVSLPPEITQFKNLTSLDISSNKLTNLLPEIGQLKNLTSLELSDNQLASLPPEIGQLQNLTSLELSDNQLASLPPEIGQLQNLTSLELSRNQLASLPPEIGQLKNLTHLSARQNQLTSVLFELCQLQSLTILDFSGNKLTSLLPEFTQLQNLISLNLTYNQLMSLPPEIAQLKSLTGLALSGNQLTSLPPEIGQLKNLTEIILYNNRLISLPPEIGQLKNLTDFNLGSNRLITLPSEIGQLTNLTELNLTGNQLTSLPPEIGQLTSLIKLYLVGNQLKILPPELWSLPELKKLHISSNPISEIPVDLWRKVDLEELGLTALELKFLPAEIGKLVNLNDLHLSFNYLISLPPEIGQLARLRTLNLLSNKLTSLPKEMTELNDLENINLWENPLEIAIPAKWLGDENKQWEDSEHAQEIINYYKQLHGEGGRPLGEARILVVGEADAGKTKLLRALLRGEQGSAFKDARDPTDGIEVNSFEAEGIKLGFWDFGGQEIMHATHRFFLSRRCVYVLVADATRDSNYNEEKIEYWLQLLQFYGEDSPVLLVASKVENFSLNVNERGLQEKYPNLVRIPALRTSAKTGAGIDDLRRAILEQAKSLPSVSVMLPHTFLAVKDALEELKRSEKVKVIEESIYRRLCEENGISEIERQNTLLALLHDMGVVLHYEDDRLSDFGILNPDWATGGVYKVVNSPQIKESQGRFTLAQLKTILADEELYPASMRRRIVDLMKKFELTFELPFERDAFILPSALPVNQPELSDWDSPTMTFEYRYPILQISALHRFIVAENDLIQSGQIWYSGVVIARGENEALVKADTRDKRITIKVKGAEESRKEFLYFIRLQFERIHGEEAKPEEYVYSPQYPELPLLFADMKTMAKSEREYKVVYKGKMVNINLRELLDGFITFEERRKDEEREKQEAKQKGMDKEDKGGDTYITNNITLGSMQGSNLVLGEGHNVHQTVQDSFNAFPAELQKNLIELIKASEALLQKAEESEHKEEIKDELESLQTEAKKSKPKKERVKVTVEGLAQAAKNLNEIGKPVLELAITVIKLINNMPA